MEAVQDSEGEGEASIQRTRSFLFGCALTSANRKFRFRKGGEKLEELLCLRMVCLGPGAPDEVHVLEAEGASQDGRPLKVPLAALKPSVQPTVSLGGIELTPPVTFRLKTGSGPINVSGQHLVTEDAERDYDGGNYDGVPTERAAPGPRTKYAEKRARAPSEDQNEPLAGKAACNLTAQQQKYGPKVSRLAFKESETRLVKDATHSSIVAKPTKPTVNSEKVAKHSKKSHTGKTAKGPPSVDEIKAKLIASVEKGGNLPKVFPKFEKFLKHCHKAEDPTCVQELWKWRQSLK